MAKRKRLGPPRLDAGGDPAGDRPGLGMFPDAGPAHRAPIADVAGDAASQAALSELSETLRSARAEGRMILRLPLDQIDESYLVRDRVVLDDEEMQTLTESLERRGQQTPVEVAELGEGRWGLISGWRRLTALRQLAETGRTGPDGAVFDTVLAIVRHPEDAGDAYLSMVEENEIRVGLSYYERARIVVRAADRGVFPSDRVALAELFHAASRPRRSKIGSFVRIVRALDDDLRFPAQMTERAGLALASVLQTDPSRAVVLAERLRERPPRTAEDEARIVAEVVKYGMTGRPEGEKAGEAPAPSSRRNPPVESFAIGSISVTTFADGRITLSGPGTQDGTFRDRLFSWLDWDNRE
ncbi:ParB N-terminal domain-containing protein [Ponticoccus sp. SC2-23]|uniref:ParB/RepB/Spo0J family partition protein n=1 Tax=Alexandriicola marinus TaxID=2081710 RepID=UPI000FDCA1F0|nr:ParB N-terminal domain-containing protein [Alexandriicola marinus]MBM1222468.1 ParB N-terminal domain-containing protein [Ponticoccus sp. SC6-9]MBM1226974.1 ParB N-terminal domain-containing protein [Ponticoccus sp. SC6-15]MBM1231395.1 ParB N-terminal domain-containing protein [Ponticoccus sp. SC6-38]MBM1235968.1 ParB N-terminal domain-containing protein [Ponticoccus sp. SC6-45]MBM1240418.1 ParB N-terminal domain-containing protein [Ponticoccus sp. SC6-49]MBM1244953.1 ParB N-terminal domai